MTFQSFRSNYFKVKDPDAFYAFAQRFKQDFQVFPAPANHNQAGKVCLLGLSGRGIPEAEIQSEASDSKQWTTEEWMEKRREIDFPSELSEHLADGEVAVFMELSADHLRFLHGYAVAVNASGMTQTIKLADIYEQAEKHLGVVGSPCEY